jgi:RNA polymerase sigma-70 factor (ECF subfamily)
MDQTTLIQSAQAGNLDAFNQLILYHQDKAFSMAATLLNNEDNAADALQNALILAFHNIENFRGGSFRAWLFRILKNVCFDELRRQKRHLCMPLEPVVDDEEFDSPTWLIDHAQNPARQIEGHDLTQAIQASLKALPWEYRMALTLVDIEGLDYCEAAETMGVPMGTVKSRLARARVKMRSKLSTYADLLPEVYRPASSTPALSFAH